MNIFLTKKELISYFDGMAASRDRWRKRNRYYQKELEEFYSFNVPKGASVIEIGCGTGELLNKLEPSNGAGIDFSPEMVKISQKKYPKLKFYVDDIEELKLSEKYDFVIMQDLIGHLSDIWVAFRNLRNITTPETRVIINYYSQLWEPAILMLEKLGLKAKQPHQNWLSLADIENILYLNNYEVIKKGRRFLFPAYIPVISGLINKYIAKLPFIKKLCLVQFIIARETPAAPAAGKYTCSVVIPAKNEAGNIFSAIERMPELGKGTEIIFIAGNSNDGTTEKIREAIKKYPSRDIKCVLQGNGVGKGDAVRKGFDAAAGDILMILDADLTVPPEDLTKFYQAIAEGKGEFINGTRLVYPMQKEAMRPLNILGNKTFSVIFTWILEQRIKDTLCGTKVLRKTDYIKIKEGRYFFGDFDPFGDFDLLFGAAKQNLKIVELPVRYLERTYGSTKISRFRHGLLLLRMSMLAFVKFKLN
ncbi:MAG: glycosyltransferase [Elusimicrobiota bacterium]